MIRNIKLKQHLQKLAISAFKIYDTNPPNNELRLFITLYNLDDEISLIKEFTTCKQLMGDDPQIKALQGKLVGTKYSVSIVENEQSCILSFLKQIYLINYIYNQKLFDEQYSAFEDLFYSDFLNIRESTHLYNFQSSGDVIELGSGISFVKVFQTQTPQEEYEYYKSKPYERFS